MQTCGEVQCGSWPSNPTTYSNRGTAKLDTNNCQAQTALLGLQSGVRDPQCHDPTTSGVKVNTRMPHTQETAWNAFRREHWSRIRAKLEATAGVKPNFNEISTAIASQWRSMSDDDRRQYEAAAAEYQHKMKSGSGAKKHTGFACGERTSQRFTKQRLKELKRKWFEVVEAEAEIELRREWEALPKDEVTTKLLAWRYGQLGEDGPLPGEDCRGRLRATLDALISQRQAEKSTMETIAVPHLSPHNRGEPGCIGVSNAGSSTESQLLDTLGVLRARLPHPALVFLEWNCPTVADVGSPQAEIDSQGKGNEPSNANQTIAASSVVGARGAEEATPKKGERAVLESLFRYLQLDEIERAALWSIVSHWSQTQELAVKRVLEQHGIRSPSRSPVTQSAFGNFCASRVQSRHYAHRLMTQDDPLLALEAQAEFLALPKFDKQRWLQSAEPSTALAIMDTKPSANWVPEVEQAA